MRALALLLLLALILADSAAPQDKTKQRPTQVPSPHHKRPAQAVTPSPSAAGPQLPPKSGQKMASIVSDSLKDFVADDFGGINFRKGTNKREVQHIMTHLTSTYASSFPKTAQEAEEEARLRAEAEIQDRAADKVAEQLALDAKTAAADAQSASDFSEPALPRKARSLEERISEARLTLEEAREQKALLAKEAVDLRKAAKTEDDKSVAQEAEGDAKAAAVNAKKAAKTLKRLNRWRDLRDRTARLKALSRRLHKVAVKLARSAHDKFDITEALFAVRQARSALVSYKLAATRFRIYRAHVMFTGYRAQVAEIREDLLSSSLSVAKRAALDDQLIAAENNLTRYKKLRKSTRLRKKYRLHKAQSQLLLLQDRLRRLRHLSKGSDQLLSTYSRGIQSKVNKMRLEVRGLRSEYELDVFTRRAYLLEAKQESLAKELKEQGPFLKRRRLTLRLHKIQKDLDRARNYLRVLKRESVVHKAEIVVRKLVAQAKRLRRKAKKLTKSAKDAADHTLAKQAQKEAEQASANAKQAKQELAALLKRLNLVKADTAYAQPRGLEKVEIQLQRKLSKLARGSR